MAATDSPESLTAEEFIAVTVVNDDDINFDDTEDEESWGSAGVLHTLHFHPSQGMNLGTPKKVTTRNRDPDCMLSCCVMHSTLAPPQHPSPGPPPNAPISPIKLLAMRIFNLMSGQNEQVSVSSFALKLRHMGLDDADAESISKSMDPEGIGRITCVDKHDRLAISLTCALAVRQFIFLLSLSFYYIYILSLRVCARVFWCLCVFCVCSCPYIRVGRIRISFATPPILDIINCR